MIKLKNVLFLQFLSVLLLFGCSSSQEVTSSFNNGKITIDGKQSDWDKLTTIKGENVAFGFSNDDNNLYLSMITNDRSRIMKIMRCGLYVWLTPENSDNRIGIEFPEKPDPSEMSFPPMGQQQPNMQNPEQRPDDMQGEMGPGAFDNLSKQKELYILNDDEEIIKSYSIDGETFKAKISMDKGNFCYELKVPIGELLSPTQGLKTTKNEKIDVEFLTGEIELEPNGERPKMGGGGGGMPPGGGAPPPGGGGPGGPGSRMGQRNKTNTTPLSYSFEVELSE